MLFHALNVSGEDQLYYVGHSQGTMMGFIGFTNETLAKHVKRFYALAPITTVENITGLLDFLSEHITVMQVCNVSLSFPFCMCMATAALMNTAS